MTKQEKIDYILKHFDFEKVQDLMIKMGGKLSSLIELKERARSNLESLDIDHHPSYILCGGFLATHFNGELSLYFTTEWCSYDGE